jgi:hypothetical protein
MKQLFRFCAVIIAITASAQPAKNGARVVDLKTSDGIILNGTYFVAAKPGPGVLLFLDRPFLIAFTIFADHAYHCPARGVPT